MRPPADLVGRGPRSSIRRCMPQVPLGREAAQTRSTTASTFRRPARRGPEAHAGDSRGDTRRSTLQQDRRDQSPRKSASNAPLAETPQSPARPHLPAVRTTKAPAAAAPRGSRRRRLAPAGSRICPHVFSPPTAKAAAIPKKEMSSPGSMGSERPHKAGPQAGPQVRS